MSFSAAEACWALPEISLVAVLCCSSADATEVTYSLILPAAVTASPTAEATLADIAWVSAMTKTVDDSDDVSAGDVGNQVR